MVAIKQLRDEHQKILTMLKIIDKIVEQPRFEIEQFERILEFFKIFADRCHHGKEEELLFPMLEKKGIPRGNGPIGVMLSEHQTGRGFIKEMNDGLEDYKEGNLKVLATIRDNARGYAHLLRNHIDKENNVLFVMAERVLTKSEQEELEIDFDKIEKERIGSKSPEYFEGLVDELER